MPQAVPQIFDAFQRIRIVNLASRSDRRREMERQLATVGLLDDPRVAFFSAIAMPDAGPFKRAGSHGAFMSHLTLLEQAVEAGETILILQDDCDFLLSAIQACRLPEQWDIFYGGYVAANPDDLHNSDIIGAHFMGFSVKAAQTAVRYLRAYLAPDFAPDARAAAEPGFIPAIRPPIDGAFVWMRRAHPELCTVFDLVGVQRASRTDIGDQRLFDRIPGVRSIAEVLRRVKRRRTQPDEAMANAVFDAND